jgi:hypothetical protein
VRTALCITCVTHPFFACCGGGHHVDLRFVRSPPFYYYFRNTLGLRTVCMKACRTSLVIKDGKLLFAWPHFMFRRTSFLNLCLQQHRHLSRRGRKWCRQRHHCRYVNSSYFPSPFTSHLHSSYDEDQKRQGTASQCLNTSSFFFLFFFFSAIAWKIVRVARKRKRAWWWWWWLRRKKTTT